MTFVPTFLPPAGGDTVWTNTVAAYETLPPALCGLADHLWALHSNVYDYAATRPNATARQVQRYETGLPPEKWSSLMYGL